MGVLLVQVDSHPFDLDKMLFMDWRDSHLRSDKELREGNAKLPTFLYAMPFSANHIFLGSILCSVLMFATMFMCGRLMHVTCCHEVYNERMIKNTKNFNIFKCWEYHTVDVRQ